GMVVKELAVNPMVSRDQTKEAKGLKEIWPDWPTVYKRRYTESPANDADKPPLASILGAQETPETPPEHAYRRYRSIWISDIHLGTRGCKAEFLLDFFRHTDSDYLYLVGDIVDGWALKRTWFWKQSHNDVIQKVLRKARKGTQVIYVPGNHDEALRAYG